MTYLLDTHTFLWFINGDSALSDHARALIEDPDHDIFVSTASLWEMAIKVSLGKLNMPAPFSEFVVEQMCLNDMMLLGIQPEYLGAVATLPFHHRDPFDRLLISQALTDHLPLIGRDKVFDRYGVNRQW